MSNGLTARLVDRLMVTQRPKLIALSLALIAVIAALDWYAGDKVSLGLLYVAPVILISGTTSNLILWPTVVLCVALRLFFTPPTDLLDGILAGAFAFVSFGFIGLFASETIRRRRENHRFRAEIVHHNALRVLAEEQLRTLVDTSPAAIFTLDGQGAILSANKATSDLLGDRITEKLPSLAEALRAGHATPGFKTISHAHGTRRDGTPFLAHVCFSAYQTSGATRLAAIVIEIN